MALQPFATADDYEAVYGHVGEGERGRLSALLLRATGYLMAGMPDYVRGADPVLDMNASTVCLSMVHRAMCAPAGMEGVKSFSQGAGPYSASFTMLDQYMRSLPSERELLGIGCGSVASVRM